MTIRVLHVGPLPPPFGGIGVMMESIMMSEPLKSYEHDYFSTSWGTNWELVGKKNLEARRVVRRMKLAGQLRSKVLRDKPQIVHFQCGSGGTWDFPGDMLLFNAAKASGAKTILHWHREPFLAKYPGKSIITKTFFEKTAGTADALIVLNQEYRLALQNFAIRNKTYIVPNAFDQSLLDIPCPRDARPHINVIFIGRLTREKGIFDLLDIAANIVRSNSQVRFVLAGTASPAEGGLERIVRIIHEKKLEDAVQIVGSVSGEKKYAFFRDGDVLLFPSYRESFGIAVLEAMASGLPVVAYSVGMLPELVRDRVSGYIVPTGHVEELASRLLKLIVDSYLRSCMGQAGRDQVTNEYSLTVISEKVKEIYESLIEVE
jgi:glycosyltransferase involved in cell wall biosynthesis